MRTLQTTAKRFSPAEQEQIAGDLEMQIAREQDPFIRAELVRTIGAFSSSRTDEVLLAQLTDASAVVRTAACQAMSNRGTDAAREGLARAVRDDSDLDVRLEATKGLGNYSGPEAAAALGLALDDNNPAIQFRAMQALKQSTKQSYGNDVDAWKGYLAGNPVPPKTPTIAERITGGLF